MMTRLLQEKVLTLIGVFIFVTIIFFPYIRPTPSMPALEISDFLIPLFAIIAILKYKDFSEKKLLLLITGFGVYILLTIFINGRQDEIKDYFEIIKLIKFASLIVIFSFIPAEEFFKKWIKPVFVALVVFNILHYFNIFNINQLLADYYIGGYRYESFGLDSLGNLTQKRMIGLVGNPNNNSIIFGFFAIFLFPRKDQSNKAFIWFAIALIMVFLCQSRTVMLALVPITLFILSYFRKDFKRVLFTVGTVVLSFFIAFFITKSTVNVIAATKYDQYAINNPDFEKCLDCLDIEVDGESEVDSLAQINLQSTEEIRADSIRFIDSCLAAQEYNQSPTYLESMVHGQFLSGSSMQGRYLIWKHLWGMIKEKPAFGHAPYKEYFYENELYFENELISMTWRYGFIGLFLYLLINILLFKKAMKNLDKSFGINLLLVIILVFITGLTNNPFAHKTVLVLYAMTIGLFINQLKKPTDSTE